MSEVNGPGRALLTGDIEREQQAAESARVELATARLKIEAQAERQTEQAEEIGRLRAALEASQQAREFHRDIAAAHDRDTAREGLHREQIVADHSMLLARDARALRVAAGCDHDVGRRHPGAANIQGVRVDETGMRVEHRAARVLQKIIGVTADGFVGVDTVARTRTSTFLSQSMEK